ncbi:MAG: hypothetical protein ACRDZQ_14010, partial [Acidimicrobiales bacterium]
MRGGRGRTAQAALAALALVASLAVVEAFPHTGRASAATVQEPLGAYAGAASPGTVDTIGQMVGHPLRNAMDFLDGTSWQTISDPSWFLSQWAGSGYHMTWGVPMLPSSGASLA